MTVYERADRPGGLLMYGIPNMKLEKDVVTRRIELMEAEGITITCGVEIGKDISSKQLMEDFDSVYFAAALPNRAIYQSKAAI